MANIFDKDISYITPEEVKETTTKTGLKALDDEDLMEITISSALYDNMRVEEFYYMENAKKYHLELQRLAGKKVVDKLNLYQFNFNSTLVGEKAVNK